MDDDFEADYQSPPMFFKKGQVITKDANGNVIIKKADEGRGYQGVIVLCIVVGILLLFVVGNYVLYKYAQKTLPKVKKTVSKKKMKRERLRQGIGAPAD